MIAQASSTYMRVTPTNVRLVINLIRGKNIPTSRAILLHANRGVVKAIQKVLDSAVNNAKQKGLSEEQLYISKIIADQGPHWKRFRAAGFGRAAEILKRTTHLTIELDVITKNN